MSSLSLFSQALSDVFSSTPNPISTTKATAFLPSRHWDAYQLDFMPRDYFADQPYPSSRVWMWPKGRIGGKATPSEAWFWERSPYAPMGSQYWLDEMKFLQSHRMFGPTTPDMAIPPCNAGHAIFPNAMCSGIERAMASTTKIRQRRTDAWHRLHPSRWDEQ